MKIGMIGLGKMGYNLALNLKDKGYEIGRASCRERV